MISISILGAGKLGTHLGFALLKKGYPIKAISCKTSQSARESAELIGQGQIFTDNSQAAREGELIIICLPDGEISKVVKELSSSSLSWEGKYVFHCSGLLTSDLLTPLKKKGALTASFHPIQSFAQKKPDEKKFKGIYFGIEGEKEALTLAKKIIRHLEGKYLILSKKNKPVYHLACTIASNLLIGILNLAMELMKEINFSGELAFQSLLPLIQETIENADKLGVKSALTGPLVRGDINTIKSHLEALKKKPNELRIYRELSLYALNITQSELNSTSVKSLKNLLSHK
ncbi:MAG: Rossmann-like and DUF2520 domain-containing protein [Candidatus Aminicenantia bacterium]